MSERYSLGLDYGSNTVRCVILNLNTGNEVSAESADYPGGNNGILLSDSDPNLARQNPEDYFFATREVLIRSVADCVNQKIDPKNIIGIGIAATASTPIPVDKSLKPLGLDSKFRENLNAMAWLWKDHTSHAEAAEITAAAKKIRPRYLKKCGGAYSSEWFFSKIYNCSKTDPVVFDAAYTWLELSDYIPVMLCGTDNPQKIKRNACAAGHKAMFNYEWGGFPDNEFLRFLSPKMGSLSKRLFNTVYPIDSVAGYLSQEWASKTGLREGTPVAAGSIDAHVGAIGAGIEEGTLVKIIGTSTCDIMIHDLNKKIKDIPGVAGIVPDSVIPGFTGIEAGQSAVGDIFNWFITEVLGKSASNHKILTRKAATLKAGQTGLLALDWNNGNRNILTDARLSGLLIGQTLHTKDFEIYRALIESTAFGALRIIEQIEKYGIDIKKIVNCGGIAVKNPLLMQIYADVINRPMEIASSKETVALGAAVIGAYVALKMNNEITSITRLQKRIIPPPSKVFTPRPDEHKTYDKIYSLYKLLHDSFGTKRRQGSLFGVMKRLIEIKNEAAGG